MRVKQNEAPRRLAHQFEFAFLDDSLGVRLFQGGVEVCHGKQHDGQGNQVYREGEASVERQPLDQKDCRGRPEPGRGDGRGCPSCRGAKVSGGSGS